MTTDSPRETGTWKGLWEGSPGVPHDTLSETMRERMSYPKKLLPAPEGLLQPVFFDPSLQQYGHAYRAGEPIFEDAESERAWRSARRSALDTVLAAIADGPWRDHLVLRGSALMAGWFGQAAREPGNLDFVVVPQDWAIDDPRTEELFRDIARHAAGRTDAGVRIDAAGAVTEDIWTYERVPGRRMLLPWTAPGVPGGTVQLDLVFNEVLPSPAEVTEIPPLGGGPGCRLRAATPELSLAWKLLWLVSDEYPQGKDLYDAMLLAERAAPSYEVTRAALVLGGLEALRPCGEWWMDRLTDEFEVEWHPFVREHPWVTVTLCECVGRLRTALAPLFEAAERPGESSYERWARWLEPLVAETRALPAADRPAALARLADGAWPGLAAAIVVTRALAGGIVAVSLEEAMRRLVFGHERWRHWRGRADLTDNYVLDALR
jgi:hypothetical protein